MDARQYSSLLGQLLNSKSWRANLLGLALVAAFFLPDVAPAILDINLTLQQRIEHFCSGVLKTGLGLAFAALPPETLTGSKLPVATEEEPTE